MSEKKTGGLGTNAKVVLGSLAGAVAGLVVTAAALRSVEFGILGAVAGAVGAAITALAQVEQAEHAEQIGA